VVLLAPVGKAAGGTKPPARGLQIATGSRRLLEFLQAKRQRDEHQQYQRGHAGIKECDVSGGDIDDADPRR
jgi:hypothetical protein